MTATDRYYSYSCFADKKSEAQGVLVTLSKMNSMLFVTLLWCLHSFYQEIFIELTLCVRNLLNTSFRALLRIYKLPLCKVTLCTLCWRGSKLYFLKKSIKKILAMIRITHCFPNAFCFTYKFIFFNTDFTMKKSTSALFVMLTEVSLKVKEMKVWRIEYVRNPKDIASQCSLKNEEISVP